MAQSFSTPFTTDYRRTTTDSSVSFLDLSGVAENTFPCISYFFSYIMPTQVTNRSWGDRLAGSIKGIFTGLLLFILSFGVLYWNEGRTNMSDIAAQAIPIDANSPDMSAEGELVAASGTLTTTAQLDDGLFIQPGNYLSVSRSVEIYAWVEKTESRTRDTLGGGQETITEYAYQKEWVAKPQSTSSFYESEGHQNQELPFENATFSTPSAELGTLQVDPRRMTLVGSESLTLTEQNTNLDNSDAELANSEYIYVPETWSSSFSSPEVGDVRVKYSVIPSGQEVTALGKLESGKLSPFVDEDKNTLYRAFTGTMDEAVQTLHKEHTTKTWILRVVGFLMMWGGLNSILSIFSSVLMVVPFLGKISGAAIRGVNFIVAFVLSLVTILISRMLHNVWAVAFLILIIVGAGTFWYMNKKKEVPAVATVSKES